MAGIEQKLQCMVKTQIKEAFVYREVCSFIVCAQKKGKKIIRLEIFEHTNKNIQSDHIH